MVSGQIAQQQMVGALTAGVAPPALLLNRLFAFSAERRSALVAPVPFAVAPPPPAPSEAALHRYYANHPWLYRVPSYRKIKAVVLTAATLAKMITVTPEELHTYYDQHAASFVTPERRSLQVLVMHDPARATALAKQWQGGADWPVMQTAAKAAGGYRGRTAGHDPGRPARSGARQSRVRGGAGHGGGAGRDRARHRRAESDEDRPGRGQELRPTCRTSLPHACRPTGRQPRL